MDYCTIPPAYGLRRGLGEITLLLPAYQIAAASGEKCVLFCRSGVLLRQTDRLSPEATRGSSAAHIVHDVSRNNAKCACHAHARATYGEQVSATMCHQVLQIAVCMSVFVTYKLV